VDRLKSRLGASERKVQFLSRAQQKRFLEERLNIVAQKLQVLSQELAEARSQRCKSAITSAGGRNGPIDVASLLAMPAIKTTQSSLNLLKQKVQQETLVNLYSTRYYEQYPR